MEKKMETTIAIIQGLGFSLGFAFRLSRGPCVFSHVDMRQTSTVRNS